MATYKAEVLFRRYRRRLRPASHYTLGQLPRWAALAARAPGAVNGALARPRAARLLKRLGGIDERRPLPRFASRTFRDWFAETCSRDTASAGSAATDDRARVLLWVDTFTNHFSPETGIAAVTVLERAGYRVELPGPGLCCGLTWISTGQLDGARRQLRRSISALAPWVEQGVPVVGLEPSCTAVFRSDGPELMPGDPLAAATRGAFITLSELLEQSPNWKPPDLTGRQVVCQPHCHQHAVLGWDADRRLLARTGAEITAVPGCCGLAGNFGMERGHYEVSAAVAETALLPAVRANSNAMVLADGFSCRTQLTQLAEVRGRHLAELLADPPE